MKKIIILILTLTTACFGFFEINDGVVEIFSNDGSQKLTISKDGLISNFGQSSGSTFKFKEGDISFDVNDAMFWDDTNDILTVSSLFLTSLTVTGDANVGKLIINSPDDPTIEFIDSSTHVFKYDTGLGSYLFDGLITASSGTFNGPVIIDGTSTLALDVRKAGNTGLVFGVDTTNDLIKIGGATIATNAAKGLIFTTDPDSDSSNSHMEFKTDGIFAMSIRSNQKVGIGIQIPERILHVRGNDFLRVDRVTASGTGPAFLMVRMLDTSTVESSWLFGPAKGIANLVDDDFAIIDYGIAVSGTTGDVRFLVEKTSGNIGLNTLTPRRRLDSLDTSGPQIRATFTDNSVFTDLETDSSGNTILTNTGGFFTLDGAVLVSGFHKAITTKTDTDYTLTINDDTVLFSTSATTRTATLPAAATVTGKIYNIKKIDNGAGGVKLDADGSETIDGGLTATITDQYENITIQSDGSNWHIL